jgi:DNA-binding response OmpR family regulator
MTETSGMRLRILVLEDEALIAMLIEDFLQELNCEIVGPASRLGVARELADLERFDCAILDVDVNGEKSYPLAECLAERGLPFLFLTGHGAGGVSARFGERPVLQKPFGREEFRRALAEAAGEEKFARSEKG